MDLPNRGHVETHIDNHFGYPVVKTSYREVTVTYYGTQHYTWFDTRLAGFFVNSQNWDITLPCSYRIMTSFSCSVTVNEVYQKNLYEC